MKDINLDILENAEDEIINELEPFSSDSDSTRKRVLSMSEKKYNDMKRNAENNKSIEVSGVEKYRRPAWYKPLCAAAAVMLLIGGTSTALLLNKNANPGESDSSSDISDVQEETTTPTEAVTEAESDGLPTEEEMKAVFEEYMNVYMETKQFRYAEDEEPDTDSIDFWFFTDMYRADDDEYINSDPDLKKENGKLYERKTLYKLSNTRFRTINELKEYYGQYFLDVNNRLYLDDHSSEYQPGDTITDENVHFGVAEYNGALYGIINTRSFENYDFFNNILCDKAYNVTEKSFTWVRTVKMDQGTNLDSENGDIAYSAFMDVEKDADGRWKINNTILGYNTYDENTDYYTSEDEYMQMQPFIPLNSGIRSHDAQIAAYNYVNDNYAEDNYFNYGWKLTDTLPDEYEHITDDFINDNNWFQYTTWNNNGDRLDVYVDCNNTVFALHKS